MNRIHDACHGVEITEMISLRHTKKEGNLENFVKSGVFQRAGDHILASGIGT